MLKQDQRRADWERGQRRLSTHLKFLALYTFMFFAGGAFFIAGVTFLVITREGWGHSVAIVIGGLFLMLMSPFGYQGDTWGIRDDDKG